MTKKYAILGEVLKHTMSPPIHSRLFELKNRDFEYEIVELKPEDLKEKSVEFNKMAGYNITIPHKIGIIDCIDKIDETAKRYGAVNCVDNKNGVLTGYNTDVDGFLLSLKASNISLDSKVLLLGCGGVGRMMGIEACREGATLTIAVLPDFISTAKEVKKDILSQVQNADVTITTLDKIDGKYNLMINATPVGMYPKVNNMPVDESVIKNCECLFDAIYNPSETKLMKAFKSEGKKAVGGMAMLVYQAVSAHRIWDNDEYTDEEVQSIIDEMNEKVKKDFK